MKKFNQARVNGGSRLKVTLFFTSIMSDDDFATDQPFKKPEVKRKDKSLGPGQGKKQKRVNTAHKRGTPEEVTSPAEAPKDVSKTATPSRGVNSLAKSSMDFSDLDTILLLAGA